MFLVSSFNNGAPSKYQFSPVSQTPHCFLSRLLHKHWLFSIGMFFLSWVDRRCVSPLHLPTGWSPLLNMLFLRWPVVMPTCGYHLLQRLSSIQHFLSFCLSFSSVGVGWVSCTFCVFLPCPLLPVRSHQPDGEHLLLCEFFQKQGST